MADIELVIKIPEEIYDFVQNTSFVEDEKTIFKQTSAERQKTLFLFDIIDAIRNGTPLPKGHGRLIDVNDLLEDICLEDNDYSRDCNMGEIITLENIDRIPTIIEANKGD